MDYVIFSSIYKDFRDAILDNIPDILAMIKRIAIAVPPICNILNIGYIKVKIVAPSSIITKEGLNDERIIFEDASGYEPVPLIQTYKTGENGMVTIEVRAKKGHKFINPELQAVKLICDDVFCASCATYTLPANAPVALSSSTYLYNSFEVQC